MILTYVFTQLYVAIYPNYDAGTFVVGAVIPLAVTVALPLARKNRVMLYAFLAYFWALVDDGPVNLDSVFTWPEVTTAPPHLLLEILYHALTLTFAILAVVEAGRGTARGKGRLALISALVAVAFVLSYAQNLPIYEMQYLAEYGWYQLDLVEHALSALVLYLAITVSKMTAGRNEGSRELVHPAFYTSSKASARSRIG